MCRQVLRDDQWERLKNLLPGKASDCGVTAKDNRLFVEAVQWIARTGAQWRDLPTSFGHWHRVYVRYNRWSHKGVWTRIFDAVSDDPELKYLMVDGSIVRVHQHGASKKTERDEQAQGKSGGGLSTKIHAAVDALGNPVRLMLTAGQASEYGQADNLIKDIEAGFVLADKGYDSDGFVASICAGGATPVIPSRKNRSTPRDYDKEVYKARKLVERFFQKLKHYRRQQAPDIRTGGPTPRIFP
ncbi:MULTISPECIES: IS5 family transposase [Spongiibacter]|uniref:IS5 family transposase n=1 Tax=Spongiibacter TaxID=630749 RepID=UPI000C3BBA22|nr:MULTISPECIES: IS5 family transposase [Spongiibacter]MAY40428.1 IS5/IS1182 family transposase [Spongiibacter sp.]HBO92544.1 IS5 family transposase [Gammaproteobacteria bacterium]|tara:strand:- start:13 stop:738 length:726 start_codon:yes stop_codon:yes gene_type:complete